MSAFMVSTAHIDYLLTGGMSPAVIGRVNGPLRWFDEDPDESAYEEGVAIPAGSLTWYEAHRRELTRATAGMVGAMLLAENRRSVDWRYAESDIEEPYLFREVDRPAPDPVGVLKALSCLEYQSCEHPGWRSSEARRFCDALRDFAIGQLPGYDEAAWAIDEVSHRRGVRL